MAVRSFGNLFAKIFFFDHPLPFLLAPGPREKRSVYVARKYILDVSSLYLAFFRPSSVFPHFLSPLVNVSELFT